jgi:hypothetical protein
LLIPSLESKIKAMNYEDLPGNNPSEGSSPKAKSKLNRPVPYLITRIGTGFLDLLVVAILAFAFEVAWYYSIYPAAGYFDDVTVTHKILEDSHLYIKTSAGAYEAISSHYDKSLTPEENYDSPIIYYYTNEAYPLSKDKLTEYNTAKIDSTYYVYSGTVIVRKEGISDDLAAKFLKDQYDKALDFLDTNPTYVSKVNHAALITFWCMALSMVLSTAIIWLIIPLTNKHRASLFQLVFKVGLAETEDDKIAKRSRVFVRYLLILAFDFILPLFCYYQWSFVMLYTDLLDLTLECFVPKGRSGHDLLSFTYVVSTRDDSF